MFEVPNENDVNQFQPNHHAAAILTRFWCVHWHWNQERPVQCWSQWWKSLIVSKIKTSVLFIWIQFMYNCACLFPSISWWWWATRVFSNWCYMRGWGDRKLGWVSHVTQGRMTCLSPLSAAYNNSFLEILKKLNVNYEHHFLISVFVYMEVSLYRHRACTGSWHISDLIM